jgi:simple sugar transport system permease protein
MLKKWLADEKKYPILVPVLAILLSFVIGSIVMVMTGINPMDAFKAIIRAITGVNLDKWMDPKMFNPRFVGEFIATCLPITMSGLAVAFAFRTGLFNIGVEGQLLMGSLAATVVGVSLELPAMIHLPLVVLASLLAGGVWGAIPGYLKARFRVHEVVVTIMMNYVALQISNYVLKSLPGSTLIKTVPSHPSGTFRSAFLSELTAKSRLHWGFIVVIISIFAFWYIIERTTFGYELRAVGFNKNASEYAGMKVNRNIMLSMAISGAFAGIAGAMISAGTFDYGRVLTGFEFYGMDGIAVALVGGNQAIGVFLSGLLFGALKSAQPLMQSNGVPLEIAKIISALMVLFVAMKIGFEEVLKKMTAEKQGGKSS